MYFELFWITLAILIRRADVYDKHNWTDEECKSIALLILSMKNKVQSDGKMMAFISGLWFTEGESLFRMAET